MCTRINLAGDRNECAPLDVRDSAGSRCQALGVRHQGGHTLLVRVCPGTKVVAWSAAGLRRRVRISRATLYSVHTGSPLTACSSRRSVTVAHSIKARRKDGLRSTRANNRAPTLASLQSCSGG